ncbi:MULTISPECIES: ABC transporter substrate-binding protein [unclassified Halomonas]|uniref:ABC transporter substrate-binding protein n=1 Tax=unclassified Halomonas TaxID=2609666 RepID=UPI0009905AC3|nr:MULTISPECIES: ABC transporter substrate-binding protein [unclassified Halomonas]AQU83520.1 iron ABC transporter substrate-binding protein [Halomonas sp. 'Soap Lake \
MLAEKSGVRAIKNAMAVALICLLCSPAVAETRVVTDVLEREVALDLPAERVFLGFYYPDYMAIGGVDAFDQVVGFSKDVWSVWNPVSWERFSSAVPRLSELADVGEVEAGTFSVEKLLSLKPDVAVLADWQYKALGPDVDRIEDAGIPIVVVDYNAQTLERHLESTHLLGVIAGEEARAEAIADEYRTRVERVTQRIAEADRQPPRVYIEFGNKGPAEYSFTYGKNMWGAVVDVTGGDNIARPYVEWWGPMNPEQVLASRPEVIIIAGRETEMGKNDEAMVMGIDIPREESQRRLAGFAERSGWSSLPAVQNGRLHGVYQGASRSITDAAMIEYFAQVTYPDLFEDLEPRQTYLDFHERYLPVVPEGTFMVTAPSVGD